MVRKIENVGGKVRSGEAMTLAALSYPIIDPVLFRIGPLELRWYGLMYLLGFVLAFFVIRSELRRREGPIPVEEAEDLLFHLIVGMLIGARLGYALIYNFWVYATKPWEILFIWHGGMSFHGGLIGMVVAGWLFARSRGASLLELADIVCLSATPGLMLGRIGNFINGELFGRPTSMPWGIVFPDGGPLPRHPSQLYESFFEGAVLFTTLWLLRTRLRRNGQLLSCFLILYGVMRFTIEFFREPDPQIGYLFGWITMGQLLCAAMMLIGVGLLLVTSRVKEE